MVDRIDPTSAPEPNTPTHPSSVSKDKPIPEPNMPPHSFSAPRNGKSRPISSPSGDLDPAAVDKLFKNYRNTDPEHWAPVSDKNLKNFRNRISNKNYHDPDTTLSEKDLDKFRDRNPKDWAPISDMEARLTQLRENPDILRDRTKFRDPDAAVAQETRLVRVAPKEVGAEQPAPSQSTGRGGK